MMFFMLDNLTLTLLSASFLSITVLFIFKKLFCKKKLDDYSKSQIIDLSLKMKNKNTNYKDFKEMLSGCTIESTKILPFCLEMIGKVHETMPKFTPEKITRVFSRSFRKRFVKNSVPKISKSVMEKAMIEEAIDFKDFDEKFRPVIKDSISNEFPQDLISLQEFDDSFKKGAVNKLDFMKISKIHLHSIPNYLKQRMINIFNNMIWGEKQISNSYQVKDHAVGISYLIYKEAKKGPLDQKSSYRTITTIPVVVNYFHRILAMRFVDHFVNKYIVDTSIHKGSIPNIKYAILEQVVKVKNCIRVSSETKPLHTMFVDISNAFPSLNIKRLLSLLREYKVDDKLLNYIETYYENLEYKTIISRDQSTRLLPWKQGLIQGCPMSPILFVIVMNYITKILSDKYLEKYGFDLLGKPIMFTAFLDDICIITNSSEGLKEVYQNMEYLFNEFGLFVNRDKTKIMSSEKLDSFNEDIKRVDQITYLGELIELNKNLANNYKNIYKTLFKKLFRTHKATYNNERKLEVFHSYILPWLRRRLVASYDFCLEDKAKLRKVVYYFILKWGSKETIAFQNTLENLMKTSKDEYIRKIVEDPFTKMVDDQTVKLEGKSKFQLLKYKFNYQS